MLRVDTGFYIGVLLCHAFQDSRFIRNIDPSGRPTNKPWVLNEEQPGKLQAVWGFLGLWSSEKPARCPRLALVMGPQPVVWNYIRRSGYLVYSMYSM